MRILRLTWRDLAHPQAGGAEVYTEQVARRWVAGGHDVTLFAAHVEGRPGDEVVDGYRVVRRGGRLSVYRAARRWWQDEGRVADYDLVIDMVNTVPFQAHRWVDDVPVVGFAHQTCEDIWPTMAPWPAAQVGRYVLEPRWLAGYRDVPMLAVSQSTRDALMRFGVADVTVVPEGYEAPAAPPSSRRPDQPTLVWCARHVAYKRPFDVLNAAALVRREIPDLQVWMLGGGPLLDDVRAAAPAGVHVLGRVSEEEKHQRMADAHLHVATSMREGWGLVVSEAAALGTPTLAYDVPGLRDSTRAAGGMLVPPTPEALARWIPSALARWQQSDRAPLPHGGAHPWDEVAADVLTAATRAAGLRPAAGSAVTHAA